MNVLPILSFSLTKLSLYTQIFEDLKLHATRFTLTYNSTAYYYQFVPLEKGHGAVLDKQIT